MTEPSPSLSKASSFASDCNTKEPLKSGQSSSPQLDRIYSQQHIDDQSFYHNDDDAVRDSSGSADEGHSVADGRGGERDIEMGESLEKKQSTRRSRDPNLVTWDGPEDPANPKNWSVKKKWAATFVVSSFTFISPVSSSMVAPALGVISREFNVTNEVESQLLLSIFVLAFAIGPLILGPLSEIYGRVPVLQLSNAFYLVFNIGCGVSKSSSQMIAFRFLSGLGGSAPLAIGGGVLSDCWRPEERGKAISIYSLAPLLGPAVGPIAGGFITQHTTWRWTFYATSIVDGLIQLSGFWFLRETYAPKILQLKADRIKKETGNTSLITDFDHHDRTFLAIVGTSLVRPFRLIGTQIIVQVLALYVAYLYGLIYLVLSTFPVLWEERYGESIGIGGLNYISLGLGFFLGAQGCANGTDRIYRILKKRNNGVGQPEFRVPLMIPGAVLVPVGLFLYGWSAQYHTHWIVPNIGALIFAAGVIVGFQCIQIFLVDSYTRYAASAVAASTVLRSLAGFGFPLFAPAMYAALDYGWGNSVLAFVALAIGLPGPFMLWKFGAKLRARSKFAAGG
ncbi:MAG: hypothetical protein M1837_002654 [Sclerophora amabilis]|nr:MAG: hypothetical protein M1837_002654 [Sclerophora amabilis]